MKFKFITLLLFLVLTLMACGETTTTITTTKPQTSVVEEPTNYEITRDFMKTLDIEGKDNVRSNIFLPKKFDELGVVKWESSDINVVTSEGFVTRSIMSDITVDLKATASLGSTIMTKEFQVVVKQLLQNPIDIINESVDCFELLENNYIDRNIMVLPRVTEVNLVYIDWATSDANIIDLNGNVHRKEVEQNVVLTGTFSYKNEIVVKDFNITVGSTKDDSPAVINENDSRILNKVYVNNQFEFVAASKDLKPGDAIILNDGNYADLPVTVEASGTKEHPIFVFAKNPGKVTVTGESKITVYGDYVTIANLNFENGFPSTDKGVVDLNGNYIRFTNNRIYNYEMTGYDFKWVSLTGRFHEIDRNTFDGKSTGGSLLTIWRNDLGTQDHHIYKNKFMNYRDAGGANGYETIRVGTSTYSQSNSNVLIEENYFENINGEIEIVSIKSGRTIVRNNTFKACVGLVCCRHGKNNLIEGNAFLCDNIVDAGGIRMYDGGHQIRNNYIENVNTSSNTRGGIVIHSGVNEAGTTTVMNLQWVPYNILVESNTIVGSRTSILFGGKYSYAVKDVYMKNNLIVSPTYGAIRFDKAPDNLVCEGNYAFAPSFLETLGTVKDYAVPQGITYSTDIPTLTPNASGLQLHAQYGAQNVVRQNPADLGASWE